MILGPKTILFWAPTFNWGFILASILDSKKKPEDISSRLLISKNYSVQNQSFLLDFFILNRKYFLVII